MLALFGMWHFTFGDVRLASVAREGVAGERFYLFFSNVSFYICSETEYEVNIFCRKLQASNSLEMALCSVVGI